MPEWVVWDGVQDFSPLAPPAGARAGDSLLLTFSHLNRAVQRLRASPKTRNHINVVSAVEQGFRGRKYKSTIKKDIAVYIAERSNSLQDLGVGLTWIARCKKYNSQIVPGWEKHKEKPGMKIVHTQLPESGPGSYYSLMYGYICKLWPKFLSNEQDFKELRTCCNRIARMGVMEMLELDCGAHCDFKIINATGGRIVVKCLLMITQTFEDVFCKSMEEHDWKEWFQVCSRSAYPNIDPDAWYAKNQDDINKLKNILLANMGDSLMYDETWLKKQQDKHNKKEAAQTKAAEKAAAKAAAKASEAAEKKGKGGGKGGKGEPAPKRIRTATAKGNVEHKKAVNTEASEEMNLHVTVASGAGFKTRAKFWLEDASTSFNGGLHNVEFSARKPGAVLSCKSTAWRFAVNHPEPVKFKSDNLGGSWISIRTALKRHLAELHEAVALAEDADEAYGALMSEMAGGSAKAAGSGLKLWQRLAQDPDVKLQIMASIIANQNEDHEHSAFLKISKCLATAKSLDVFVESSYTAVQDSFGDEARSLMLALPKEIKKGKGVVPEECDGLISIKSLDVLVSLRAKTIAAVLNCARSQEHVDKFQLKAVAAELQKNVETLGPLDAPLTNRTTWINVWTLLLRPLSSDSHEFTSRIDAITTMTTPLESLHHVRKEAEASDGPGKAEAAAAGGKAAAKDTKEKEYTSVSTFIHETCLIYEHGEQADDGAEGNEKCNEIITMRTVHDFIDELGLCIKTFLYKDQNKDKGYSLLNHCKAVKKGDGKKRKDQVEEYVTLISAPRQATALKLSFCGPVHYSPKENSLQICEMWGQSFYMTPCCDFEGGLFYPAWLVKAVDPGTKADNVETPINMTVLEHSIPFTFSYLPTPVAKQSKVVNLTVKIPYLQGNAESILKKGVVLARPTLANEIGKPSKVALEAFVNRLKVANRKAQSLTRLSHMPLAVWPG